MPPKPTIDKENVLEAALALIREEGADSVNARNIARRLNCSTNPLFRLYENMDALKKDVYREAEVYYETYLRTRSCDDAAPFLRMGLNYMYFAKEEKNLFHYIFLSHQLQIDAFHSIADMADTPEILGAIMQAEGVSENQAKTLFSVLWLLTHGMACAIAANTCAFDEKEIRKILVDAYRGQLLVMKEEKEKEMGKV